MKRLTTFILLWAVTLAAATGFGPPVGSRFRGADVSLGPKGAVVLFNASKARMQELEAHRDAFQKVGVGLATLNAASAAWFVLDPKGVIVAKYFDEPYTAAAILVSSSVDHRCDHDS